jgi:uncharacterized protein YbbC (DUF1343 family)
LAGRSVALLAHPASVTKELTHALDALAALPEIQLTAAFGPQHGLRGDQQDNMRESEDFFDARRGIPVFSLYGKTRTLTAEMLDHFDVLLVDLQDVGCRIYTFITTLRYVLEACASRQKAVWVLDRPNPAGRPIEGLTLRDGWESFVGAGALPMRHGLTLGELTHWFVATLRLKMEYQVIPMEGWRPELAPGYGWPVEDRIWVNPSPNAASLSMARAYAGTVLLEGTTLSEGRGTTRPLEMCGAPDLDVTAILNEMRRLAPEWMTGCALRECGFEPVFHKHAGRLCQGLQIHAEPPFLDPDRFHPWRLLALFFKALRRISPEYPLWRDFVYEYESDRLPIDLINGSPLLREWVDDSESEPGDLNALAVKDEALWAEARADFLLYR